MTGLSDAIKYRRSVRDFTGETISPRILNDILEHAIWAPSPKNEQPWSLQVIGQPQCRELWDFAFMDLSKRFSSGSISSDEWEMASCTIEAMKNAAAACFVVLDSDYENRNSSSQIWDIQATDSEVSDLLSLGMLAQNAMLRSYELGIGTLCICDHFAFYDTVARYLNEERPIVLGLLFGKAKRQDVSAEMGATRKPLHVVSNWKLD